GSYSWRHPFWASELRFNQDRLNLWLAQIGPNHSKRSKAKDADRTRMALRSLGHDTTSLASRPLMEDPNPPSGSSREAAWLRKLLSFCRSLKLLSGIGYKVRRT